MKVEIINKEEVSQLFSHFGEFAATCYDTKTTKPEAIGKHCLKSGHFSGSRSRYIEFRITGIPRFLIDQLIRKEVGTCKNVQSFRYVNKDNFDYSAPVEIEDNIELLNKYNSSIIGLVSLYNEIHEYVENKTNSNERASEQARYCLPMSTNSSVTIGMTIESLIQYMNKRLCVRTEDVHRQLAEEMKLCVLELLPELTEYLVPQCEYLTWCPEGNSCGRFPKRNERADN